MKTLLLVFLLVTTIICSAQSQIELESNQKGVYRVKEGVEWELSGITTEPEAIKYINKFSFAVSNPGTPILVGQTDKTLELKPVFKKLVETEEKFIIYKENGKTIRFFVRVSIKEQKSYLVLFSIASTILMIISNILFKIWRDKNPIFVFASLFAFSAATANIGIDIIILANYFTTFITTSATLAAAATVIASVNGANKSYKVASIIFYILMVMHIVLLFI